MSFVFKKDCSDLLIFGDRNPSVSKFTCDTLYTFGEYIYGKAKKLHMVFLISVCTEFLQLGEKKKYYFFLSV